ncbi:RNA-guided endonuclease TnpB family protein, partial [Streptomyces sp. ME18-1-4]|uniref:RNA-guided endonuclease TnpB family protein n=1 Tax=Streptomyces sp. ME18-1-4 TaxID=3028685 RepID=UPI0029A2AC82
HHQLSTRLISENQGIAVESLSVAGLARTRLAKSVHDAGWSQFVNMLEYKAERYGRTLIKIGRFEPTSQTCSTCGVKDGPKPLSVREWTCTACGTLHDRDHNAAIGVTTAGGAAQYAVAPVANCVRLPEHVRTQDAALVEPLSCAVRGYDVLRARLGAHVLIYGSGTMGLMMLELAKRTGAAGVDVVDVNPARLETARRLGVSGAAASPDELERPQGWDLVVDATGNAAAIQDGLDRVAKAGTFLQFGVADYATRVTIDPYRIYNQEITVTGSMAVLHSFERAAELFANGVLDPEVFISDRIPLERYPQALEQFAAGIGRKIVVVP